MSSFVGSPAPRHAFRQASSTFLRVLVSATMVIAASPAVAATPAAAGQGKGGAYIATTAGPGRFPLVAGGRAVPIVVNSGDYPGVVRVVGDLQGDIQRVTGVKPDVAVDAIPQGDIVIVGTIGRSPL